jgi:hypothetical protein
MNKNNILNTNDSEYKEFLNNKSKMYQELLNNKSKMYPELNKEKIDKEKIKQYFFLKKIKEAVSKLETSTIGKIAEILIVNKKIELLNIYLNTYIHLIYTYIDVCVCGHTHTGALTK